MKNGFEKLLIILTAILLPALAHGGVGAPDASCWVPQSEAWQVASASCQSPGSNCPIMMPAGLGVCSGATVMIPLVGAYNGVCQPVVAGILAGNTFAIPSQYADPSNPYAPPVCQVAPVAPSQTDARVFDPNWYLENYSDLRAAFGTDTSAATQHWLSNGINEGRQGNSTFSTREYLSMYPDLVNAFGITNYSAALQHYLTNGINEGRAGRYVLRKEVFNASWYLQNYADLSAAFGSNTDQATQHWLTYGIYEGRQASPGFSSRDYLSRYADLEAAFGPQNYYSAIVHYITYGINEGRIGQ